jgi:D-psicose/D-tagatose/L-ribulose 3-epimerase
VRFGASTFIWTSPFGDDTLGLLQRIAEQGFDTVEICVEDPTRLSGAAVARAAADAGLEVLVCGAFGPSRDVSHADPDVRAGAIAYLRTCVDIAQEVGSPLVAGPMYSATGRAELLDPDDRAPLRERAVEALQTVAAYAAERDVTLAIEPLNRFETDLVNTVEQGVALCADIGGPNVGLLLDTFHMNIEEKDIGAAIRSAGTYLRHFHACENDRGAPGSGHIAWPEVFAALADAGFDDTIVIESFTPEIKEIARAVSLWRPVAPDGDTLAREGLAFLRSGIGAEARA